MADTQHKMEAAAQEAAKQTKSALNDVTEQVKSAARDAAETVKSEAAAQAEAAKEATADGVGSVASALRKAAQDRRHGSVQERTFAQIAETLADASDAISNKDLGTVARDAGQFARRHPLTFLAGAALAGFAVGRFMKASERNGTADTDGQV